MECLIARREVDSLRLLLVSVSLWDYIVWSRGARSAFLVLAFWVLVWVFE